MSFSYEGTLTEGTHRHVLKLLCKLLFKLLGTITEATHRDVLKLVCTKFLQLLCTAVLLVYAALSS